MQIGGHVEAIGFVVFHFAEQLFAFEHMDVAGGAGVVAAAGMVEKDPMIQGDIQERLALAMIFIGQLSVLEFYGLVFRLKGHPYCVGAKGLFRCCTAVLAFLVGHNSS